jgi:hypothetical protein
MHRALSQTLHKAISQHLNRRHAVVGPTMVLSFSHTQNSP